MKGFTDDAGIMAYQTVGGKLEARVPLREVRPLADQQKGWRSCTQERATAEAADSIVIVS